MSELFSSAYWCHSCMAYHREGFHLGISGTATTNTGSANIPGIYVTVSDSDPGPKYDTFDDAVHDLATQIAEMVIAKQWDYGQDNILGSPYGPEAGLLTRLWDKICRLKNLIDNDRGAKNESLTDTYKDIVGYGLLGLMIREGTFELPLREDTDGK